MTIFIIFWYEPEGMFGPVWGENVPHKSLALLQTSKTKFGKIFSNKSSILSEKTAFFMRTKLVKTLLVSLTSMKNLFELHVKLARNYLERIIPGIDSSILCKYSGVGFKK